MHGRRESDRERERERCSLVSRATNHVSDDVLPGREPSSGLGSEEGGRAHSRR